MGYYGNDGFIFAWDLGVIFLGIPSFKILRLQKKLFLKFGFYGVIEKCVGCFLVYLFLGGFFWLKSVKKCACVVALKIALLLVKNMFINVGEVMSKLGRCAAAKHTTPILVEFSPVSQLARIISLFMNNFQTLPTKTPCLK